MLGLNKNKQNNKQSWVFYCPRRFEKKMIQQYIDNLNNIFHEYRIYVTSDREDLLIEQPEKLTFVYEVFDIGLTCKLLNTMFSFF